MSDFLHYDNATIMARHNRRGKIFYQQQTGEPGQQAVRVTYRPASLSYLITNSAHSLDIRSRPECLGTSRFVGNADLPFFLNISFSSLLSFN
jgi:hypothetical protein